MSFVHLHLHTQYSLLDGANKISDLMPRLKRKLPTYAHTWKVDSPGAVGRGRNCVGGIPPSESCGRFSL